MSLKIIIPALVLAIADSGTIAVAADNAAAGWGTPDKTAQTKQKAVAKTSKPAKTSPKTASPGKATQSGKSTGTSAATKSTVSSAATSTEHSSTPPADPVAAAKESVSAWKEKHDELWRGQ